MRKSRNDHDGLLLKKARSDPRAFAKVYRSLYDPVFRYCVHRLFDRHAAEDVTSAVFLNVLRSFGQFRGDQGNLQAWVFRIANNCINTHLRKNIRRLRWFRRASRDLVKQPSNDLPQDEISERMNTIKKKILSLKPREQTVLTLRFFEKMKFEEIAKILDCTPATARSLQSRTLKKLEKRLTHLNVPTAGEVHQNV